MMNLNEYGGRSDMEDGGILARPTSQILAEDGPFKDKHPSLKVSVYLGRREFRVLI